MSWMCLGNINPLYFVSVIIHNRRLFESCISLDFSCEIIWYDWVSIIISFCVLSYLCCKKLADIFIWDTSPRVKFSMRQSDDSLIWSLLLQHGCHVLEGMDCFRIFAGVYFNAQTMGQANVALNMLNITCCCWCQTIWTSLWITEWLQFVQSVSYIECELWRLYSDRSGPGHGHW